MYTSIKSNLFAQVLFQYDRVFEAIKGCHDKLVDKQVMDPLPLFSYDGIDRTKIEPG